MSQDIIGYIFPQQERIDRDGFGKVGKVTVVGGHLRGYPLISELRGRDEDFAEVVH